MAAPRRPLVRLLLLLLAALPLTAVAPAAAQSGTVTITITEPTAGALVGDTLQVVAIVRSPFEIESVRASLGDRSVALTRGFEVNTYRGTLVIQGVARGPQPLTVIVRDVRGITSEAMVGVTVDERPAVVVESPIADGLARPTARVRASCTDDGPSGCVEMRLYYGQYLDRLVTFPDQDSIDYDLSLLTFEGQRVRLQIRGYDSAGQMTAVERYVYVNADPRFEVAASVAGRPLDYDGERVVYAGSAGDQRAIFLQTAAMSPTLLLSYAPGPRVSAKLTPRGAMFLASLWEEGFYRLYEWRDGQRLFLSASSSAASYQVEGNYALWGKTLLDYTDVTTATIPGWVETTSLAANGDVVYEGFEGGSSDWTWLFRYRDGQATRLPSETYAFRPLTDGNGIVYLSAPSCCTSSYATLVLDVDGQQVALRDQIEMPSFWGAYRIAGGWVAFPKKGPQGVEQLWTRSPDGQLVQRTFFNQDSAIVALNGDGQFVFKSAAQLYLGKPDGRLINLGPRLLGEEVRWVDGVLHRIVGDSVLRLSSEEPEWQPPRMYLPLLRR